VGGRSTAIKLSDGDVWVLASTPLCDQTKAKLRELGDVRYIIGADLVHNLYLGQFQKAYPDAKLVTVEGVIDRIDDNLRFDGLLGRDPPNAWYGFENDIKYCYFSGFKNRDAAFFHPASKTMVEADLLFNLPAKEQYSETWSPNPFKFLPLNPYSSAHRKFVNSHYDHEENMRRDAKTVASWDFDRVIPCHGDVIETGGNAAWRAAYQDFLN